MAAGPLLGGLIAATAGIEAALLADAATFLLVALAGLVLRARRPPAPADEEHPDRARDGVVHLFRDRVLAVVLGVVFVSLLFMSATITAEVFFLREDLGVGDALYGLIFSTWMLGMVIGAVVLSRRVAAASLGAATLVAVGIQGLGIGAPAVWVAVGFTAAAWFVGGVAHGAKNVFARTLIQERVPERIHGRAFAAYNGMRNGAELFALAAGGVLVSAIGARGTLALAGAVPIAAAVIGLALYGRAGRSSPSGSDDSPGSGRPGRRSS
jgi:Na+/melibiose symporter-like transporter